MKQKKKKTSLLGRLIVLGIAIYCAGTLISLQVEINQKREQSEILQAQIQQKEQENAGLREDIESEIDDAFISEVARNKLGMVAPGERIFIDMSQ